MHSRCETLRANQHVMLHILEYSETIFLESRKKEVEIRSLLGDDVLYGHIGVLAQKCSDQWQESVLYKIL